MSKNQAKSGPFGFEPKLFGGYCEDCFKMVFTGKLRFKSLAQHWLNISNNTLKMLSDRLKRELILFLEKVLNPFGYGDGKDLYRVRSKSTINRASANENEKKHSNSLFLKASNQRVWAYSTEKSGSPKKKAPRVQRKL